MRLNGISASEDAKRVVRLVLDEATRDDARNVAALWGKDVVIVDRGALNELLGEADRLIQALGETEAREFGSVEEAKRIELWRKKVKELQRA